MSGRTDLDRDLILKMHASMASTEFLRTLGRFADSGDEDALRLFIASGILVPEDRRHDLAISVLPVMRTMPDRGRARALANDWLRECGYGTPRDVATLLVWADSSEMVATLMDLGADRSAVFSGGDGVRRTVLGEACRNSKTAVIDAVMREEVAAGRNPVMSLDVVHGIQVPRTVVDYVLRGEGNQMQEALLRAMDGLDLPRNMRLDIGDALAEAADQGRALLGDLGQDVLMRSLMLAEFRDGVLPKLLRNGGEHIDLAWILATRGEVEDDVEAPTPCTVLARLLGMGLGPDQAGVVFEPRWQADFRRGLNRGSDIDSEKVVDRLGLRDVLGRMIHAAALSNNVEALCALLEAGADPRGTLVFGDGRSSEAAGVDAFELARLFDARESLAALEAWSARNAVADVIKARGASMKPKGGAA